jgi:hypothetical protein
MSEYGELVRISLEHPHRGATDGLLRLLAVIEAAYRVTIVGPVEGNIGDRRATVELCLCAEEGAAMMEVKP